VAGSIKGITIEICGDTTKLSKALSGVNSSCSSLQKELREVDKLLKLDPTNTELLAQKQKILKEAIGSTKEKLDTLKEAEKQVQEQFENGEVSEEQYRALQREIASTEIKLGDLEKQAEGSNKEFENTGKAAEETAKSVSKIDTAAKAFDTVEDKAGKAAKTMAPLSAAAAAAAMNLDDGYDIIITKTGATGEVLDDLNKRMNNIFKDIPTDAETAGTAIGEVNTRFQLTGDKLESLSKQFIEFAEINETDLNSSIDNVDTILNKFNVDAGQAGNVLGLLTKVGQDTGLSMDTLESSLMQNGSTLKEMGLGITESVNLLAMFENNGVDATTAMAGLKKAVKNYTAEGLSTDQALQKTIDSIKNASTETEALSIAQETFGSKGFAEMAQAIREGKLSVDDLGGSLEDYGTTVQDTYESTLDPWDNAKVMLNNLKLAGSDLAGTALSALQPAIEKVTSTVQSATEWFRGLTDNQKEMIATIVMIVAAIAPALLIINKVAGVISTMINVIKALKIAIVAVNDVLVANPIILVIAAIAALIAIFITLYNKCEWFRDAVNEIFEYVKEFIGGAIEVIKGVIGTIWDKIQGDL
jgi:phage-related minor tail protein